MPCRRKLHILRFAFRGKSSVVPLLLLSPPNPLRWALAGPLLAAPLNPPGVMFWRKPDVLCAYHLAMVRVTRLRRLRCREANTLGVRSAYSLASARCTTTKDRHISKTTRLLTTHHAGYSSSANVFAAVGAVSMSPAEAVLAASHGCMEEAFAFKHSVKS